MSAEQTTLSDLVKHLDFNIEECEIEECEKQATHLAIPKCEHGFIVCTTHARKLYRYMRDQDLGACDECGQEVPIKSVQPIHP